MELSPEQFISTLRTIVREEVREETKLLATKQQVDDLTTTVDGMIHRFDAFLHQEWQIHLHDTYPRLEQRVDRIERKLDLKPL